MQVESRLICKSPKTPESKLADYVDYIEEGQLTYAVKWSALVQP